MIHDCICGRSDVATGIDDLSNREGRHCIVIDCSGCGRTVVGISEQEAQSMWNAVIERLKKIYKK